MLRSRFGWVSLGFGEKSPTYPLFSGSGGRDPLSTVTSVGSASCRAGSDGLVGSQFYWTPLLSPMLIFSLFLFFSQVFLAIKQWLWQLELWRRFNNDQLFCLLDFILYWLCFKSHFVCFLLIPFFFLLLPQFGWWRKCKGNDS